MELLELLQQCYPNVKETRLHGRYITMQHIEACSFYHDELFSRSTIGFSVEQRPLELFAAGSGSIRILMWSQMHGNESTTTRAVADLFNFLKHDHAVAKTILEQCTLYIIPILNPDGALAYTRENANGSDLNRDAQRLLQPESRALRTLCDTIKPHFCFNLHDQRSIYGVGNSAKPAVISFLSPLADSKGTITPARKKAMQLIVAMHELLQRLIPGHTARYDDSFTPDCMGDTLQALGIPTLLFEAGHYGENYDREHTRMLMFYALIQCLYMLSEHKTDSFSHENYFNIPENTITFFDILITNIPYKSINDKENATIAIGIQYKEVLKGRKVIFLPIIEKKGDLFNYYGHKMLNYNNKMDINSLLRDKNIYKIVASFINTYN